MHLDHNRFNANALVFSVSLCSHLTKKKCFCIFLSSQDGTTHTLKEKKYLVMQTPKYLVVGMREKLSSKGNNFC